MITTIEDTEEKTTFTFDESDDHAKDRVRQEQAESMGSYDWAESVVEDFREKAKAAGFDVEKEYWSGFWSQGDGASFTGRFYFRCADAEGLLDKEYSDRWVVIKAGAILSGFPPPELTIEGRITQGGRYCHEYTMGCELDMLWGFPESENSHEITEQLDEFCQDFPLSRLEETVSEAARDLARDFYESLEKEYEYQLSDENLSELAAANEWLFDEDGNMI